MGERLSAERRVPYVRNSDHTGAMTYPPIPPSNQPPQPQQASPGWYPVAGGQRWWDGRQWGQFAPGAQQQVPTGPTAPQYAAPPQYEAPLSQSDANLWSALSHASFFILGIIGPALIRYIKGKIVYNTPAERYLRQQSTEALNFQITFMIVWAGGIILWIIGGMLMAVAFPPMAIVSFIIWPVLMLAYVGGLVYAIMGIMAGSKGQPFRYPVNYRFFRD